MRTPTKVSLENKISGPLHLCKHHPRITVTFAQNLMQHLNVQTKTLVSLTEAFGDDVRF